MKEYFQYGWCGLAVSVLVIMAGYYFVLQEDSAQYAFYLRRKNELQSQVQITNNTSLSSSTYSLNANQQLKQLLPLLERLHLSLQVLANQPDTSLLKIKVQGEFRAILAFMHAVAIKNYHLSLFTNQQLELQGDVDFSSHTLAYYPLIPWVNPFCRDKNNVNTHRYENEIMHIPLNLLRLSAIISGVNGAHALVQLPNHRSVIIDKGMRMGKEGAQVIVIQPDSILLQLSNQKQIRLKLH